MTSAASLLIPTAGSALTSVRYYQPLDPYYYTVDNRPIGDLDVNTQSLLSGPIAALFRAEALSSINTPMSFGTHFPVTSAGYATGFQVSVPAAGTTTVGTGVLYLTDTVNSSVSLSVVKQFSLPTAQSFSLSAPALAGQSINYLIQIKTNYLDTSTMATSALPFLDATNAYLPGLLTQGEAKLSVAPGSTAAATGSQTTPAAESGAIPLYVVTIAFGGGTTVKKASGAPAMPGLNTVPRISFPSSSNAASTYWAGQTVPMFDPSSNTSINLLLPIDTSTLNPTADIKLEMTLSSSVGSNAAVFKVYAAAFGAGDVVSNSVTSPGSDTVTFGATANTVTTLTTSTSVIPNTVFASLNGSNVWAVTKPLLLIQLWRLGLDGADTNTGNVSLLNVRAYQ